MEQPETKKRLPACTLNNQRRPARNGSAEDISKIVADDPTLKLFYAIYRIPNYENGIPCVDFVNGAIRELMDVSIPKAPLFGRCGAYDPNPLRGYAGLELRSFVLGDFATWLCNFDSPNELAPAFDVALRLLAWSSPDTIHPVRFDELLQMVAVNAPMELVAQFTVVAADTRKEHIQLSAPLLVTEDGARKAAMLAIQTGRNPSEIEALYGSVSVADLRLPSPFSTEMLLAAIRETLATKKSFAGNGILGDAISKLMKALDFMTFGQVSGAWLDIFGECRYNNWRENNEFISDIVALAMAGYLMRFTSETFETEFNRENIFINLPSALNSPLYASRRNGVYVAVVAAFGIAAANFGSNGGVDTACGWLRQSDQSQEFVSHYRSALFRAAAASGNLGLFWVVASSTDMNASDVIPFACSFAEAAIFFGHGALVRNLDGWLTDSDYGLPEEYRTHLKQNVTKVITDASDLYGKLQLIASTF